MRSPSDRRLERGDPITTAIGYWGGLCCRAGLLDDGGDDYLERTAIPYWRAIAAWWESIELGVDGGEIDRRIRELVAPALNPGHLGHLDEWVHSPIRPGSVDPIRSGMVLGLELAEEVLPLSAAPAYFPPFRLTPERALVHDR